MTLTAAEWLLLGIGLGSLATWVSFLALVVFANARQRRRPRDP